MNYPDVQGTLDATGDCRGVSVATARFSGCQPRFDRVQTQGTQADSLRGNFHQGKVEVHPSVHIPIPGGLLVTAKTQSLTFLKMWGEGTVTDDRHFNISLFLPSFLFSFPLCV